MKAVNTLSGPKAIPSLEKQNRGKYSQGHKCHQLLRNAGWNVIVVWECELKKNIQEQTLERLAAELAKPRKTQGEGEQS